MGVAGRFKNCLQGILGSTAILPEAVYAISSPGKELSPGNP
jgi:hypothetical protein